MAVWWRITLEERLSQGDVVQSVPAGVLAYPRTAVRKTSAKGILEPVWAPDPAEAADANGQLTVLAKARVAGAVVLSHSCELDKGEKKGRVLLAPVRLADTLRPEDREIVFTQRRRSLMPLPNVPGVGDVYADLREMQAVDRRHVDASTRLASMTPEALDRLHLQLVGFIVRGPAPA